MAEFFTSQMDYIYFFYGLTFILLLPLCHFLNRRPKRLLPWILLGLFGLTHGLSEWLNLLFLDLVKSPLLTLARIGLMILSYVFLMEFARTGTLSLRGRAPGRSSSICRAGSRPSCSRPARKHTSMLRQPEPLERPPEQWPAQSPAIDASA